MRNTLRLCSILALSATAALTGVHAQNVGINTSGALPNAKALLDISVATLPVNAKRGLLIPRMTEAQRLAIPVLVPTPATGLWVYQLDDHVPYDPKQTRGLWYHDGTIWQHMSTGNGWLLAGNGNAAAPGNFLGTTGAQDLLMRSVFPLTIQPQVQVVGQAGVNQGNVGINTLAAPVERLEVNGAIRTLYNGAGVTYSATDQQGTIRFQTTPLVIGGTSVMQQYHYGNITNYGTVNGVPPHSYTSAAGATYAAGIVTVSSTAGLYPGDYVTITAGTGAFYPGTYVNSILSATTFNIAVNNGQVPIPAYGPTTALSGGAVVSVAPTSAGWRRMENVERQVLTNNASIGDYAKDTLICAGVPGLAVSGTNSAVPALNANTPVPSNGNGMAFNRGFRAQYIYSSADLVAAGLCAGNITAIAFYALQDEQLAPACAYNLEIRAGTSALAGFNLGIKWDDAIQASAPKYSIVNYSVAAGLVNFNFSTPVAWAPGQNFVVDVTWLRTPQTGLSPTFEMWSGGSIANCTRWGMDNSPGHGNTYDDNPNTPATIVVATTTNRPVTRFSANVKTISTVGSHANYVQYSGALLIDSVMGGSSWGTTAGNFRGPGTAHARDAVFDGNLQLSDHVFDRYYGGKVRSEDAEVTQGYAYVGLAQMKEYLRSERHLPNMPSREDWGKKGTHSLGELQTGLWETVEDQALRIGELEKDLHVIEGLAFGALSNDDLIKSIADVQASRRLTEEQKLHLAEALRARMTTSPNETH